MVTKRKSRKQRENLISLYETEGEQGLKKYLKRVVRIFGSALKDHAGFKDIQIELLQQAILPYVEGERKTTRVGFADSSVNKKRKALLDKHDCLAQKILGVLLVEDDEHINSFRDDVLNDALAEKYNSGSFDIDHWLSQANAEEQEKLVKEWEEKQLKQDTSDKDLTHKERAFAALVTILREKIEDSESPKIESDENETWFFVGELTDLRKVVSDKSGLTLQQVSGAITQLAKARMIKKEGVRKSSYQKIFLSKDRLPDTMQIKLSEDLDANSDTSVENREAVDSEKVDKVLALLAGFNEVSPSVVKEVKRVLLSNLEELEEDIERLKEKQKNLQKQLELINSFVGN